MLRCGGLMTRTQSAWKLRECKEAQNDDLEGIETAIEDARRRVDLTPEHHPDQSSALRELSLILADQYGSTSELSSLEEAIQIGKQAIATASEQTDQATWLSDVACLLYERYTTTGDDSALDECIQLERDALKSTPSGLRQISRWGTLSDLLYARHRKSILDSRLEEALETERSEADISHAAIPAQLRYRGRPAERKRSEWLHMKGMGDLEEAIQLTQLAIDESAYDHPDRQFWLLNQGCQLFSRFYLSGVDEDLGEAIRVTREARNAMITDPEPEVLNNLGELLDLRSLITDSPADIEEAVRFARQAAELATDGLHKNIYLVNLAYRLRHLYLGTKKMNHLDEAIQIAGQAVNGAAYPLDRLEALDLLGSFIFQRFCSTANISDLNESIELAVKAAKIITSDRFTQLSKNSYRGLLLSYWYDETCGILDATKATEAAQKLASVVIRGRSQAHYLRELECRLSVRYERTGQQSDLRQVVQVARQVVDMNPRGPDRVPAMRRLCHQLEGWYNLTGDMTHLDEAIQITKQLAVAAPNDFNLTLDLSLLISDRFQSTGDLAEIHESIEMGRQAIEMAPEDAPDLPWCFQALGKAYYRKHLATRARGDLDEAIQFGQQALDALPEGFPRYPVFLSNLSCGFLERYKITSSAKDLESSIQLGQQALNDAPESWLKCAMLMDRHATGLHERYLQAGILEDLEEAIRLGHQAISLTQKCSLARSQYEINLMLRLGDLYNLQGSTASFDEAVKFRCERLVTMHTKLRAKYYCEFSAHQLCHTELDFATSADEMTEVLQHGCLLVDATAERHLCRARYISNLAMWHCSRFRTTKSNEDLEDAIRLARQAVDIMQDRPLESSWYLSCLTHCLSQRFVETMAPGDLEEALSLGRLALDRAPLDHPGRPWYLLVFASAWWNRYWVTGRLPDLHETVRIGLEALDASTGDSMEDHCFRWRCCHKLSVWFGGTFLKVGAASDFERGIGFMHASGQAYAMLRQRIGVLNQQLRDFETGYYSQHLGTKGVFHLEPTTKEIGQHLPPDISDHAARQHALGAQFSLYYDQYGYLGFLDLAISLLEPSVEATPYNHVARLTRVHSLAQCYQACYMQAKSSMSEESAETMYKHLDSAIMAFEEIMDRKTENESLWVSTVHCLGGLYWDRFEHTRATADLKMAFQLYRDSVSRTPQDHPSRSKRLYDLGMAHRANNALFGDMDELAAALVSLQEALDLTPLDSPERPYRLMGLASIYHCRYDATGCRSDLQLSLQMYQEASEIGPDEWGAVDARLASGYMSTFAITGHQADLESAIAKFQRAIDKAKGGPSKVVRLVDISQCYLLGYTLLGTMTHLEMAVHYAEEATKLSQVGDQNQAVAYYMMGQCYLTRYEATNMPSDLDTAIAVFDEAFYESPEIQVSLSMGGVKIFLEALIQKKAWGKAYQVARIGTKSLRSLVPRFLDNRERLILLAEFAGLAQYAAAFSLHSWREPVEAMLALEEGRGIAADFLDDLRLDMSRTSTTHPEIAKEFLGLRDKLKPNAGSRARRSNKGVGEDPSSSHETAQRIAAATSLNALILDGRSRYHGIVLGNSITEADIFWAATDGPIVVINISYRCDALLVRTDGVTTLPLNGLSTSEILRKAKGGDLGRPEILEWLWDTVANPILEALGFTQPPTDDNWPRVWWMPTGLLSKFPIHAAGRHTARSNESVVDRVMSSYCTSVKDICRSRRARQKESASTRAVFVAMESTPDSQSLPFAGTEVQVVQNLCKAMSLEPAVPGKRTEQVVQHLQDCKIFHFAGHGYTDETDPLSSHLRLEDWRENPLTAADLLDLNLRAQPPFLAYLSACGTGRIKDQKFFDESIHLVSTCQLAGFRHVIGTLWEVDDEKCVDMARIVYEGLRDGGMTDRSVCSALHKASLVLRDEWVRNLSKSNARSDSFDDKDGESEIDKTDGATRSVEKDRDDRKAIPRKRKANSLLWVPYVHFGP